MSSECIFKHEYGVLMSYFKMNSSARHMPLLDIPEGKYLFKVKKESSGIRGVFRTLSTSIMKLFAKIVNVFVY